MNKVTLTRGQVLKLATFLALDEGIENVEIKEDHNSGIGSGHRVWFNKSQIEKSFSEDITDVSNW
jgi:hypothetical protein